MKGYWGKKHNGESRTREKKKKKSVQLTQLSNHCLFRREKKFRNIFYMYDENKPTFLEQHMLLLGA